MAEILLHLSFWIMTPDTRKKGCCQDWSISEEGWEECDCSELSDLGKLNYQVKYQDSQNWRIASMTQKE